MPSAVVDLLVVFKNNIEDKGQRNARSLMRLLGQKC